MVGIHSTPREIDLFRVFWRELTVIGARVYERRDFEVQLQLLDKGPGSLTIEYDAASPGKEGGDRLHRAADPWYYTNSGNWTTVTFVLHEAAFANRQGGGGDFRLVRKGAGISLRWIQVRGR